MDLADHLGVSVTWVEKNAKRMGIPYERTRDLMEFDPNMVAQWIDGRHALTND